MRIVHEVRGECQVMTSGRYYSYRVDIEPDPYRGAQIEVLIVGNALTDEADPIYIEGDLDHILRAFEQAVESLRGLRQVTSDAYDEDVRKNWAAAHERYLADEGADDAV